MQYKITSCHPTELSSYDLKVLSLLHRKGKNFYMWPTFCEWKHTPSSRVALSRDRKTGKILGWAFLYGTPHIHGHQEVHLYVRRNSRRMGIGRMLLQHVRKLSKTLGSTHIVVFPHDEISEGFFKECANSKEICPYDMDFADILYLR